jgi:hypothetical protein
MFKYIVVAFCITVSVAVAAFGATRGDDVLYVGGTLPIDEKTKGSVGFESPESVIFSFKGGSVQIPYKGIKSIEYGQKAGRRVGVAIAVTPLALFSKKRKHYVTLAYTDAGGAGQGAVFEFGKKTVRNALTVLETRTGLTVEYESEEAKKNLP